MDDAPLDALDAEFELTGTLGSGGSATVLRARERSTGREVALKVCERARGEARFRREGQVVAQLDHPGIVRVHRLGTLGGRLCLAYELVPGARPLTEVFREVPLSRRLDLLGAAAEALGVAHAAGVVHRDVKGENLLVDEEGRVRVADFGIATGAELERLTQTGVLVGTPICMAPEQVSGGELEITPATDVWALGCLLYEALCGQTPFVASSGLIELSAQICAGSFPRPRELDPAIPAPLEALCLRALRATPSARFPDGAAFAAALARARQPPATSSGAPRAFALACGVVLPLALVGALASRRSQPANRAGKPRPSATITPAALPTPRPSSPAVDPELQRWRQAARESASRGAWKGELRPPPRELLERPYPQADSTFVTLLELAPRSLTRVGALAGALLRGHGVARDRSAALEWLRWGSACRNLECAQLLLRELTREDASPDELREGLALTASLAARRGEPEDLLRLWQLARHPHPQLAHHATESLGHLPPKQQLELSRAIALRSVEEREALTRWIFSSWRASEPERDRHHVALLRRVSVGRTSKPLVELCLEIVPKPRARQRYGSCMFDHPEIDGAIRQLAGEFLLGAESVEGYTRLAREILARRWHGALPRRFVSRLNKLHQRRAPPSPLLLKLHADLLQLGLGRDVPRPQRARHLYTKALAAGAGEAALGLLELEERLGEGRSPAEVARLLEEGARKGSPECARRLAHCYREGRGVVADPGRAAVLLRQAVEAGSPQAMVDLADSLWASEPAEARRLCEQAAAAGSEEARKRLRENGF